MSPKHSLLLPEELALKSCFHKLMKSVASIQKHRSLAGLTAPLSQSQSYHRAITELSQSYHGAITELSRSYHGRSYGAITELSRSYHRAITELSRPTLYRSL
ncbi:hypothetical protein JOB18_001205 [Solea senegalensis]|uniref:Uncharacterized protein n=1 Tax=Solea senegalensis TaxID=28829 RepID=A0AAV6PV22_SOLSE|nr:hypothetical protein JOB18_001205 [Solea senegalensis]